mmetsp:Transcript_26151/g.56460  ORF Transcript_26151/g.56460 Transcript_26151/m.56460 type:complete len:226 (-) Transcript_26151:196-873(-)
MWRQAAAAGSPVRSLARLEGGSHGWAVVNATTRANCGALGRCTRARAPARLAAIAAGASASIKLNVVPASGGFVAVERAHLALTYLSSWRGMGVAQFRCSAGCRCEPLILDGHRGEEEPARHVTVWERKELAIVLLARSCRIDATVLNRSRSGEHAFEIVQINIKWPAAGRKMTLGELPGCGSALQSNWSDTEREPRAANRALRMMKAYEEHLLRQRVGANSTTS